MILVINSNRYMLDKSLNILVIMVEENIYILYIYLNIVSL